MTINLKRMIKKNRKRKEKFVSKLLKMISGGKYWLGIGHTTASKSYIKKGKSGIKGQ